MNHWYVYLIRAAGGAVYTGITLDVARRLREHDQGKGAKYLRGRGPLAVVYRRKVEDRSLALRVERRLKRLTKRCGEILEPCSSRGRRAVAAAYRAACAAGISSPVAGVSPR